MSSHRFLFYDPDTKATDATITLEGVEHHHLARVLRVRPGEDAFVTDGRGLMAECTVETVGPESTVLAVRKAQREADPPEVTLALALLKKDRFAQALEQTVELGATRCLPFSAECSKVDRYGSQTLARLRRVAVAAMKQSFRPWLTRVEEPVGLDGVLAAAGEADDVVVGMQGGQRWSAQTPARHTLAVVGPEAGFAPGEAEALRGAGGRLVSVSRHRLRSETAAVALVAAILHRD
jgi:16S rRNA (uracil1498-N3)-methyltransferase